MNGLSKLSCVWGRRDHEQEGVDDDDVDDEHRQKILSVWLEMSLSEILTEKLFCVRRSLKPIQPYISISGHWV